MSDRGNAARLAFGVVASAYVVVRVALVAGQTIRRTPDAASYMHLSFLGHAARFWTVPLLYDVAGTDHRRAMAQAGLAGVAWFAVAAELVIRTRHRVVGLVGGGVLLLFGTVSSVAGWDGAILSESVFLSLTLLFVVAGIEAADRRTRGGAVAFGVVALLWVFTRQGNIILFVLVAVAVSVVAFSRRDRRITALAAALVVTCVWVGVIFSTSAAAYRPIARFNSLSILMDRVVPDPSATAFFVSHGMPELAALQAHAGTQIGRDGTSDPLVSRTDRPLIRWVDRDFLPTYAAWLATHPAVALVDPLRASPQALLGGGEHYGFYANARRLLPPVLDRLAFPGASPLLGLAPLLVGATAWAVAVAVWRRPLTLLEGAALAMLVVGSVNAWTSWLLSSTELNRLFFVSSVLFKVAPAILLCCAIDRMTSRRAQDALCGHEPTAAVAS